MSNLIEKHLTWLRAGKRSPRTITARGRLLRHAERCLPRGLDRADADDLAEYLARPAWSQWTAYTYFGHLAGYYRWAVLTGKRPADPTAQLIHPEQGDRLPDPATDDELAQALAALPAQPWRMAVQLAAWAGLRCCEIVSVRREDCSAEWIRVIGKGGRWATVPTAPQLWAVIEAAPAGLLVRSATGLVLTAQRLTQTQGAVWDRIGQPHQHLHRFRHKSILSTQGYTAVADSQRQAAVRLLPGWNRSFVEPFYT